VISCICDSGRGGYCWGFEEERDYIRVGGWLLMILESVHVHVHGGGRGTALMRRRRRNSDVVLNEEYNVIIQLSHMCEL